MQLQATTVGLTCLKVSKKVIKRLAKGKQKKRKVGKKVRVGNNLDKMIAKEGNQLNVGKKRD